MNSLITSPITSLHQHIAPRWLTTLRISTVQHCSTTHKHLVAAGMGLLVHLSVEHLPATSVPVCTEPSSAHAIFADAFAQIRATCERMH